jgi:hypothetical protein
LAPNGFSTVFMISAAFRYDTSTAGSDVISNTRPLLSATPLIWIEAVTDLVRCVFAT